MKDDEDLTGINLSDLERIRRKAAKVPLKTVVASATMASMPPPPVPGGPAKMGPSDNLAPPPASAGGGGGWFMDWWSPAWKDFYHGRKNVWQVVMVGALILFFAGWWISVEIKNRPDTSIELQTEPATMKPLASPVKDETKLVEIPEKGYQPVSQDAGGWGEQGCAVYRESDYYSFKFYHNPQYKCVETDAKRMGFTVTEDRFWVEATGTFVIVNGGVNRSPIYGEPGELTRSDFTGNHQNQSMVIINYGGKIRIINR